MLTNAILNRTSKTRRTTLVVKGRDGQTDYRLRVDGIPAEDRSVRGLVALVREIGVKQATTRSEAENTPRSHKWNDINPEVVAIALEAQAGYINREEAEELLDVATTDHEDTVRAEEAAKKETARLLELAVNGSK